MSNNRLFTEEYVAEVAKELKIANLEEATIGEVLLISSEIEKRTGVPFIRMDQGSPGLPSCIIGREAEKRALDNDVASQYPAAGGVAPLKSESSRFIKAFLDVDISPVSCIPTVGSVAASFGAFIALSQCYEDKKTVLFIDPGFPIQRSQLRILGVEYKQFDIYNYRGEALREKLTSIFEEGGISSIVYSNPNNPAWISLEESELKIIGELATKYDLVVLEDMAYFCMDFRNNYGTPWVAPFMPTVAKYTDNYIIMLSSSKIFSYAGQRVAVAAVSDVLFNREFSGFAKHYGGKGHFGSTFTASIMYMITSGVTHSTQFGYAEMLRAATDGELNFVEETREYARRAEKMKKIFTDNGFNIVYNMDVTQEVGDGFFFTIGYNDMDGGKLLKELLYYGVSSISLSTTGSEKGGVRACTSRMRDELYPVLEERMKNFQLDHK